MLYLLVRLGNDAYAIGTAQVSRIVPLARLKAIPSSLPEVAGVLNFHGQPVPVIDLTFLLTGEHSAETLGTRIVITGMDLPGLPGCLLGLIVEGAHSVARFEPSDFQTAGIRPDGRSWLGPIVTHEDRFVQRIDVAELLPPATLDALLRDAETAFAA